MKRKSKTRVPWGRISALLAACLSTLVGVASGLEPFIVLQRSMLAAIAVGLVVCMTDATVRSIF